MPTAAASPTAGCGVLSQPGCDVPHVSLAGWTLGMRMPAGMAKRYHGASASVVAFVR